jgi:ribosomal protein S18 acetylase RimI-like enzyme
MQVRPAQVADVPAVLPMVRGICALHQTWDPAKYTLASDPAERYRHWLSARAIDPRGVFLVAQPGADDTGFLAGFLIGTVEKEIPIYKLTEYGFIHDLWVEPNFRHEGIARQMTMLAIEKFAAIGVKQVRLDTAAANDAARALFTSCGFRPSTVEMLLELNSQ